MKKRIISLLLVLMMVMTLMPMAALADDDPVADTIEISTAEQFKTFIETSDYYTDKTIVLLNDIDMEAAVLAPAPVVFAGSFDGQGHKVSNFTMDKPLFGGHIRAVGSVKNLTVENVTLNNTTTNARLGIICVNLNGVMENVNVVNCAINSEEASVGLVGGLAAMTQNGCTAKNCTVDRLTVTVCAVQNDDKGHGGVGGAFGGVFGDENTVITNVVTSNIIVNASVDAYASSLFAVNRLERDYDICGNEDVASAICMTDGSEYRYLTFSAAVEEASDNANVVLLKDIVIDEPEGAHGADGKSHYFYATIENKLTIDLSGKTISFSDAIKEKECGCVHAVFGLVGNADVTITGNGTIDSFDGKNQGGIGAWLRNAPDAKLTIQNGTFYGDKEIVYVSNGGTVVITGGHFENNTGIGDGNKQLLNVNEYCANNTNGKSITMYGGTIVTCDPRFMNDGSMVAPGYLVSKRSVYSEAFDANVNEYTVIPNDCRVVASVTTTPADYDYNHPGHTAEFGEFPETVTNYYTSLEAAQAAAKAGDTVNEIVEADRVEHLFVTSTVAPTCTERGYTLHSCSVCGYSYKNTYVDALGHNYVSGKCDACGESKPYTPPVHSHSYTATVVAPTCTEQGYTLHKCSCGASYKDTYVDALGHDYKDGVCSGCEAKDPNYVPPHEHSYTDVVTAPTCIDKGFTTHTCACGDVKVDTYVDALGHDFKNGVCTRCGAKDVTFNPFKDVDKDTHKDYYDAILWAYYNDITKGTNAAGDMFSPELGCTRAQIVTFLWRQSGAPVVEVANPFVDVDKVKHADYYNAILWGYSTGVVKGVSATEFDPDRICTRAEIVTMLYRLDGENAVKTGTQFTDLTQDWYKDAIAWAVAEKITKGTSDTTFTPDAPCTRAQTVTFLYRYFA